ncbi:phasin family protein [Thauera sp.]|jgi:phasin family protein|uniref:phasin family protein n=1 Tax=Thauera sp. TaxID=1905334 RepID=UPI002A35E1BC|nr:phasin family protein [Thauera sp.]MDX9884462.1 phasin family protein [Thauera sp.]
MQAATTEQKRTAQTYTNAVGALSEIAFSSVERLSALNQKLARAAMQDCLAASNDLLAVRDVNALQNLQTSATAPVVAQLADYLRSVQEIATKSQQQAGEVFKNYFGTLGLGSNASANMQAGFDMLSKMTRQTRDMMDANIKTAGEAGEKLGRQAKDIVDTNVKAAGEAGDKLAASMTPNPKKAA